LAGVVELNRSDWLERDGVAEDEVDVLTNDSIEGGLIGAPDEVSAQFDTGSNPR
jgi:hypothetical protein